MLDEPHAVAKTFTLGCYVLTDLGIAVNSHTIPNTTKQGDTVSIYS